MVEDTRISCGIAARCASDGALVDVHHLVEMLESGHLFVPTWDEPGSIDVTAENIEEHVVHESGLT